MKSSWSPSRAATSRRSPPSWTVTRPRDASGGAWRRAQQRDRQEVVQETWIALLKGIGSFEGRSSLRTWLFTVLINIAKRRGMRERRDADVAIMAFTGATVDPARFRDADDPYPGHWRHDEVPSPFPETPERSVLGDELINLARRELDKLPERQRVVVMMRDMLGLDSAEVCDLLEISIANQRVLLHRGRAAVRQVLEDYLRETI